MKLTLISCGRTIFENSPFVGASKIYINIPEKYGGTKNGRPTFQRKI